MSGKLFYDSVVGEGTTFHMEFATVAARQPAVILSAADNTDDTPTSATTGDTPEAVQA